MKTYQIDHECVKSRQSRIVQKGSLRKSLLQSQLEAEQTFHSFTASGLDGCKLAGVCDQEGDERIPRTLNGDKADFKSLDEGIFKADCTF